jgi:hypothetical protein
MNTKSLRQIVQEVMTQKPEWAIGEFVGAIQIIGPLESPDGSERPVWVSAASVEGRAMMLQQTLYGLLREKKVVRVNTDAGPRWSLTEEHRDIVLKIMEEEKKGE